MSDTPVKNALTPSTTEGSGQTGEELGIENKKDKIATYLKRDSQNQKAKIKKKSKTADNTDEEDSEHISCLYCRGASRKMWIQRAACMLRSQEEYTQLCLLKQLV